MNACKLPNSILTLGLTPNELYVYAYLCSIHGRTATLLGDLVKVKQSTIAEKCRLSTTETVSRIVSALMCKGLVQRILRGIKADGNRGTNSYILSKPSVVGGFFYLERCVFGELSAREFRVYLFMLKSYSRELSDSWNSYNDIAGQLKISRKEAIEVVAQLVERGFIVKQRRKSRTNRRVFVDNHYAPIFTVKHRSIRRTIKTRGLRLSKKRNPAKLISTQKKMIRVHNIRLLDICQALFRAFFCKGIPRGSPMRGGSPTNQGSLILPKLSLQKKKNFRFFKIFLSLRMQDFFKNLHNRSP